MIGIVIAVCIRSEKDKPMILERTDPEITDVVSKERLGNVDSPLVLAKILRLEVKPKADLTGLGFPRDEEEESSSSSSRRGSSSSSHGALE